MSKSETEYLEFISEVRDTAYRLVRSIVISDADAEDIVQDLFERVWRARDAVLENDYPRAYVCRMARNLAIDRQRRQVRERSFALLKHERMEPDGDRDTSIGDMATITLKIIRQLPEMQQVAIHMRDVEGYEIEEIASILESDEVSVRMNLSRARKRVREELIKIMNYGVK